MALRKSIETPHGATAEYWRIAEYSANYLQRQAQVILCGYISEAARRAGKQHLAAVNVVFEADDFIGDFGRAEVYASLKARPQFADADDLLEGGGAAEPSVE